MWPFFVGFSSIRTYLLLLRLFSSQLSLIPSQNADSYMCSWVIVAYSTPFLRFQRSTLLIFFQLPHMLGRRSLCISGTTSIATNPFSKFFFCIIFAKRMDNVRLVCCDRCLIVSWSHLSVSNHLFFGSIVCHLFIGRGWFLLGWYKPKSPNTKIWTNNNRA